MRRRRRKGERISPLRLRFRIRLRLLIVAVLWYVGSMKQKTSITLSEDVLRDLVQYAGAGASRSAYIERVLRRHFRQQRRAAAEAEDIDRINAAAERLNVEAEDVLEYQTPWPDP